MKVSNMLLHWAAQLDQITREMEVLANYSKFGLAASHEIMVCRGNIIYDSRKLVGLADKFKDLG